MKSKDSPLSILILKDQQIKVTSLSKHTQKCREKINLKIRELGEKFYKTKSLLERLNFHRDELFEFGKYLEERYKKPVKLQTQSRRMKDALYCWFAENFFEEMFDPKSTFLNELKNYKGLPSDEKKFEFIEDQRDDEPHNLFELDDLETDHGYNEFDMKSLNQEIFDDVFFFQ